MTDDAHDRHVRRRRPFPRRRSSRPCKDVVDPELGINVVDLGLVYGVNIDGDGRRPST